MRDQLRELPEDGRVVLAGSANQQTIPWFFSNGQGEVEASAEMGGVEAEEFLCEELRIVFEGFEDPEERILRFDSWFGLWHGWSPAYLFLQDDGFLSLHVS
jgi:hypothetical protein